MTSSTLSRIRPADTGGWLVVVVPGSVVAVDARVAGDLPVDDYLAAMEAGDGVQAALDILTRDGLTATPPFVLVRRDATALRCIVRGPAVVRVADQEETQNVSAAGVSTWLERSFAASVRCEIDLGVGADIDSDAGMLPLAHGAAWADAVALGDALGVSVTAERDAADSAPMTAPVVVPAPVPAPAPVTAPTRTPAPAPAHAPAVASVAAAAPEPVQIRVPDSVTDSVPDRADIGDHDGLTILTDELAALRARAREQSPRGEPDSAAAAAFVVELADGTREHLGQPLIVGRAPSVSQVVGAVPRLLTVASAEQDISRSHLRLAVEGDVVVATDLHSRNGTVVTLPGASPRKLRQGEPTTVLVGTLLDLGGGVTLRVCQDGG